MMTDDLIVCANCAADPDYQRAVEAFGGALVGNCGHVPPADQPTEPANDESCEICQDGDGELDDDVVANHVDSQGTPHLAHTDCAESTGWRLA